MQPVQGVCRQRELLLGDILGAARQVQLAGAQRLGGDQGAAALESVKSRARFRPEHWIWSGQLRQGLARPAAFVRSRKRLYDEATDASRNFKE